MSAVVPCVELRNSASSSVDDLMLPPGNSSHCKCAACGLYFKSVRAFERHRAGPYASTTSGSDRACVRPARMPEAGLELDLRGFWRFPKRKFRNIYLRAVS